MSQILDTMLCNRPIVLASSSCILLKATPFPCGGTAAPMRPCGGRFRIDLRGVKKGDRSGSIARLGHSERTITGADSYERYGRTLWLTVVLVV